VGEGRGEGDASSTTLTFILSLLSRRERKINEAASRRVFSNFWKEGDI
jgi:hypothetical protein